jgi:hypothetical protein
MAVLAGVVAVAGCVPGEISGDDRDRTESLFSSITQYPHRRVCAEAAPGMVACNARVRVDASGAIQPFATPSGLTPPSLQAAYNLNTSGGAGATIAIVDAQDDPNAEKDLATYRSQFGLPACTTANGCFKKVNQSGVQGSYPTADTGWAGEIALDLDMASAACPNCKIILVEANSANMSDLGAAENTAASLGATVISNSYGGGEDSSDPSSDSAYFNHPGVAIFVSAGDSGYGAQYPASSPNVIAVGGTSLVTGSTARGWAETVWNGTGSGCSSVESKPSWQKDTGCSKRTVGDVSAVADPNTGVAVYDTYGGSGWAVYGGTSAASPLVAAIFALTGHGKDNASLAYANPGSFYDVTSGSNGSCGGSYLCTAKAGYDGPTGVGTPNGGALSGGGTGCTPNCSGKSCGADGCGGSCGSCASGQTCSSSGTCVAGCTPSCGGKTCGSDGCGGSCGTCATGSTCSATGTCVSSGGGGSCSHPICSSGGHLTSGCDPCATKICAADSYCCSTAWDSICVGEVSSICGQSCTGGGGGCTPNCSGKTCGSDGCGGTCGSCASGQTCSSAGTCTGGGGGGSCSHSDCSQGTKLVSGCNSCVTSICAKDPYCCSTKWDSICVGEVGSICGVTC